MLFDDLKRANMEALKAKDQAARAALGLAINKAMLLKIEKRTKNEDLTDNDVLVLINKSIKELDEEILAFKNASRDEKVEELSAQRKVLEKYLPKMLSEEEIKAEIAKLEDKSMPSVMKHFKVNFAGRVDMKLVNTIANQK